MTATTEWITPEKAAEYLALGGINRNPKTRNVKKISAELKRGEWRNNGQSISISVSGRLLNGQHRLLAIIDSGIPAWIIVVRGCDDDSFPTIDCGVNRTLGDTFTTAGVPDANFAGATVKRCILLGRGARFVRGDGPRDDLGGNRVSGVSNNEALDEYFTTPLLYRQAMLFAGRCYAKLRLYRKSEIAATYAHLVKGCGYDEMTVETFLADLHDQDCVGNSPAALLRKEITKRNTGRQPISGKCKQVLLVKAWNAYAQGRALRSLVYFPDRDDSITFVKNLYAQ